MADRFERSEIDREEWESWLAERPPEVRALAIRRPPWKLYRMKDTGRRVFVLQYDEYADGSVNLRVAVTGDYNVLAFERAVFGIEPDDLVECDLPEDDEVVGVWTQGDLKRYGSGESVALTEVDPDLLESSMAARDLSAAFNTGGNGGGRS